MTTDDNIDDSPPDSDMDYTDVFDTDDFQQATDIGRATSDSTSDGTTIANQNVKFTDLNQNQINEIKSQIANKNEVALAEEDKFFNIPGERTVLDLRSILEEKYSDILKIDFSKKESNENFWFISKNKEEPRLANRYNEQGSDLEQPLAIARDIKKLYERISNQKNSLKIGKFLIENNDIRHVVRRAFISEKFPYSEIQDNTIGSNLMPIDMLRLKLSFFGAVKFDPKSDKWLRISMFQGAPLPNELKKFDDYWVYNSLN